MPTHIHHIHFLACLQAVGEGLGAYPLTPAVRIALFELTCCGTPWAQVCMLHRAPAAEAPLALPCFIARTLLRLPCFFTFVGAFTNLLILLTDWLSFLLQIDSDEPGASPPRIVFPQAAALLLRLAAASDTGAERAATLGMLCRMVEWQASPQFCNFYTPQLGFL